MQTANAAAAVLYSSAMASMMYACSALLLLPVQNNSAASFGGALYLRDTTGNASITRCMMINNAASKVGAIVAAAQKYHP